MLHYTSTQTHLIYSCIIISREFCLNAEIDTSSFIFCEHRQSNYFAELLGEMTDLYKGNDLCRTAKLQIIALKMLSELRENYVLTPNPHIGTGSSFETIRQVIKFIRENYDKKLTLDMISKSVYADKYSVSRNFKVLTGQTLFQYINNYRCSRVNEFIARGMTVNEAARLCGFNNMSFFTRTFKKMKGKLPSKCKNSGCFQNNQSEA